MMNSPKCVLPWSISDQELISTVNKASAAVGNRAGVSGFSYSSAIKTMGGKWGFEDMNAFLKKPKKFMPGTKMSFSGFKKDEDIVSTIEYLKSFQTLN